MDRALAGLTVGHWHQVVLQHCPELTVYPARVGDDEDDAELIVGEPDRDEEFTLFMDAFPQHIQQCPVVPYLVKDTIDIVLFNQSDVTVVIGILWVFRLVNFYNQSIDEFLDDGISRICRGELQKVYFGFKCNHVYSWVIGDKKSIAVFSMAHRMGQLEGCIEGIRLA